MRLYPALRGYSCGSRGFLRGPDDGHNHRQGATSSTSRVISLQGQSGARTAWAIPVRNPRAGTASLLSYTSAWDFSEKKNWGVMRESVHLQAVDDLPILGCQFFELLRHVRQKLLQIVSNVTGDVSLQRLMPARCTRTREKGGPSPASQSPQKNLRPSCP